MRKPVHVLLPNPASEADINELVAKLQSLWEDAGDARQEEAALTRGATGEPYGRGARGTSGAAEAQIRRYSDAEERDDHGRWTAGGGSAADLIQAAKEPLGVPKQAGNLDEMNAALVSGLSTDLVTRDGMNAALPGAYSNDNQTRGEVKEAITAALSARMVSDPEFKAWAAGQHGSVQELAAAAAQKYADQWAESAADTNPTSIAMQQAVADVFGLKDTAEPWRSTEGMDKLYTPEAQEAINSASNEWYKAVGAKNDEIKEAYKESRLAAAGVNAQVEAQFKERLDATRTETTNAVTGSKEWQVAFEERTAIEKEMRAARDALVAPFDAQYIAKADAIGRAYEPQLTALSDRLTALRNDPANFMTPSGLAKDVYAQEGPAMRAYARAEYAETQQFLADHGVHGNVTLMRGMDLNKAYNNGPTRNTTISLKSQPASSWTTEPFTAEGFGYHVTVAQVPTSRILSTARSGSGCLPEGEIRVLGGTDKVMLVRANPQDGTPDIDRYLRSLRYKQPKRYV